MFNDDDFSDILVEIEADKLDHLVKEQINLPNGDIVYYDKSKYPDKDKIKVTDDVVWYRTDENPWAPWDRVEETARIKNFKVNDIQKSECTCESKDLFNQGCTCGYIKPYKANYFS